jgi:hypothetical protein
MYSVEGVEGEASVGVIDSVYDPEDFGDYNRVGRTFDILECGKNSTVPHGYDVANILAYFTHDPEFHFLLAVNEQGKTHDSYLMKALGRAIEYGEIDVINMSVGCDHVSNDDKDCTINHTSCALCDVAEKAVDQGITIVAASGNTPHVESICCPSLSEYTISVGGAVTRCTASAIQQNGVTPVFTQAKPPNAYWVDRDDGRGSDGVFCSGRGCMPGENCVENKSIELWEHNVDFTDRKPDILAPSHIISEDKIGPFIQEGTSFSAPIVTAGGISVVEWANSYDGDVSTADIRQAIRQSGKQIPGVNKRYFSAQRFTNTLRSNKGLAPYDFEEENFVDLTQMDS